MRTFLIIAFTVALIVAIGWHAAVVVAPAIEEELGTSARALVQTASGDLDVSVDGQQVIVSGSVEESRDREWVGDAVREINGVTGVSVEVATVPKSRKIPENLRLTRTEARNTIVVSGIVSGLDSQAALIESIRAVHEGEVDVDVVETTATGERIPVDLLEELVPLMSLLQSGTLQLTGKGAMIRGTAETFASWYELDVRAREVARGSAQVDVSAPVPAAGECQTLIDATVGERRIEFVSGSDSLRTASMPLLAELSGLLRACPYVVEIGGHTDGLGHADDNRRLSLARANTVLEYLTEQGVKRSAMIAQGYGSSAPIADDITGAGQRQNRRVEFKVLDTET